ncbi:hypothetical protein BJ684DRAFT_16427 [Piptocephalis cylindrospora]|uniref:Uncharacterized protein n=1 Tax=Piptocephalis cylindrospora TaxID=1907219 RepID=A0A4P9Y2S4_9FUNG|nr:hypothetical protein BJ684DRAFT_16427 [Piptocephalis cylindrospora]|eukprot:RKP13145.1 hypothetical protein BJ684DRAFT_16427 [Piptocephalis cylindrospora]
MRYTLALLAAALVLGNVSAASTSATQGVGTPFSAAADNAIPAVNATTAGTTEKKLTPTLRRRDTPSQIENTSAGTPASIKTPAGDKIVSLKDKGAPKAPSESKDAPIVPPAGKEADSPSGPPLHRRGVAEPKPEAVTSSGSFPSASVKLTATGKDGKPKDEKIPAEENASVDDKAAKSLRRRATPPPPSPPPADTKKLEEPVAIDGVSANDLKDAGVPPAPVEKSAGAPSLAPPARKTAGLRRRGVPATSPSALSVNPKEAKDPKGSKAAAPADSDKAQGPASVEGKE